MEAVVVGFNILEEIDSVLSWFKDALWPLTAVRHEENPGVECRLPPLPATLVRLELHRELSNAFSVR